MKYYSLLFLLFSTSLIAQTRDTRAKLDILGGVKEICVSPDEKIWLVSAVGNSYYTNSIDSNWHYGPFKRGDEDLYGSPHFDRISFFNKDTAILTGYISAKENGNSKNGYYRTTNGGKDWKLLDFGGNEWVYDVFLDKNGNAWMGGSDGDINYTSDFGLTWKKLKSPYNSGTRMHSIFMETTEVGISGALHNAIYTTSDNWKSHKKVETPLDQKMYEVEKDYGDDRIEKVLIWGDYYVVNQDGRIFYSRRDKIEWMAFESVLTIFELNKETQRMYAISDNFEVLKMASPTDFKTLGKLPLGPLPMDLAVVDHSVYVITSRDNVYRFSEAGVKKAEMVTTEHPIVQPEIIRTLGKLTWGITGKEIFLSINGGKDWHRENVLDFSVDDFTLQDDSTAILWNGFSKNYTYSLATKQSVEYQYTDPLQSFLEHPIKSLVINAGSRGCFHSMENEVEYTAENDSILSTKKVMLSSYSKDDKTKFTNQVSSKDLMRVLQSISEDPSQMPSIQDFNITDEDIKNYQISLMVGKPNSDMNSMSKEQRAFYRAVPARLDSLNPSILWYVLNERENIWSTTSNWFTVELTNANNQTIGVSRNYFSSSLPWNLPWQMNYKGQHFNSYSVEFSRFIDNCIPNDFMDKDIFDNKYLIWTIADFLYKNEIK
jgi:hypothetical protein